MSLEIYEPSPELYAAADIQEFNEMMLQQGQQNQNGSVNLFGTYPTSFAELAGSPSLYSQQEAAAMAAAATWGEFYGADADTGAIDYHQHSSDEFTSMSGALNGMQGLGLELDASFNDKGASVPIEVPVDPFPQDIQGLIESSTSSLCMKILEEPSRRKPGRKPKGMQATQPPAPVVVLEPGMDKKDERKIKNRIAADQSRKRLRERSVYLEFYASRLKQENEALRSQIAEIEAEVMKTQQ